MVFEEIRSVRMDHEDFLKLFKGWATAKSQRTQRKHKEKDFDRINRIDRMNRFHFRGCRGDKGKDRNPLYFFPRIIPAYPNFPSLIIFMVCLCPSAVSLRPLRLCGENGFWLTQLPIQIPPAPFKKGENYFLHLSVGLRAAWASSGRETLVRLGVSCTSSGSSFTCSAMSFMAWMN